MIMPSFWESSTIMPSFYIKSAVALIGDLSWDCHDCINSHVMISSMTFWSQVGTRYHVSYWQILSSYPVKDLPANGVPLIWDNIGSAQLLCFFKGICLISSNGNVMAIFPHFLKSYLNRLWTLRWDKAKHKGWGLSHYLSHYLFQSC